MGFVSDILTAPDAALTRQNKFQAQAPEIERQNFQPKLDEQYGAFTGVQKQQQDLANVLMQQMSGSGPNPAQMQFQQNLNQVGAQQAGAIASQKGISPALAARMIAQQGANAQVQGAGQAATLQAQQQLAAQEQLQQQQSQMANQALSANQLYQQSLANQNALVSGNFLGAQQINAGISKENTEAVNKTRQSNMQAASGAMSMAAMSDENQKTDVKDFDASSFLEAIKAHQFKYKDKAYGEGKQVGVMAQDVEKEVPQMVADTPEGKVLDLTNAGGPILASLASLHERLSQIEGNPQKKAYGGKMSIGEALKSGGRVPGRAKVKGDSPKNDTVHAMLSPGEIVVPRSLVENPERAKKFIEGLKKRRANG